MADRINLLKVVVSMLLLAAAFSSAAALPADNAYDAAHEARVRNLADSFRCLVCQNQTLADSNADLAADLRERIREQVQQGATDAQIQAYMVQRYGDFVLYRPPVKPLTWLLWFGPLLALVCGAIPLFLSIKRRRHFKPRPLDSAERSRAEALLAASDQENL